MQTIPVRAAKPLAAPANRTRPLTPARPAAPAILVADDEPIIVELLALLLEDEGYSVRRAFDGEEAWAALCHGPADLVISDIWMPNLDGLALVRRLRVSQWRTLPVILMSAHDREVTSPYVTFVAKPFDLATMVAMVDAALHREVC